MHGSRVGQALGVDLDAEARGQADPVQHGRLLRGRLLSARRGRTQHHHRSERRIQGRTFQHDIPLVSTVTGWRTKRTVSVPRPQLRKKREQEAHRQRRAASKARQAKLIQVVLATDRYQKKAARANTKPYRDPPHRPSVRACPTPYRARRRPRWWAMVSGATNNCLATLPSRLHRSRVRKRVRRPSAVSTDLQPYPRVVYIHRSIPPASDPHPKRSLPDCCSDAASGKSRKSNRVCMTARAHLVLWEAGLAGLI